MPSSPATTSFHRRTCPLCEAMCGIVIEHRGEQIVSIKPNREDVLSHGHICPKAVALKDLHEDPDRLRAPLRREGEGWREVGWNDAYDEIEARIEAIRAAHGHNAVAIYAGNPVVHNLGAMLTIGGFIRAVRTRNLYSATSADQLPHMVASQQMFGHQFLMPVPDIDRTQLFVCIGGNPVASGGSIMGAPGFEKRLRALHARGGRMIVIDPRRTETAELADLHLPVRPGGDAFVLLAVLHELLRGGSERLGHLSEAIDGLDVLREAVLGFDPAALAQRSGIALAQIVALARDLAAEERAVVYGRVGACTQEFGGLTMWLIYVLNALTGHLDAEGGAMLPRPAVDVTHAYGAKGHYDRFRSQVRQLPEFGSELPVAALAEEILTPSPERIRALFTVAGNPVLSTPNGRQLDTALAGLDFMVSIDPYLNETSRHAHLILPTPSALERPHHDIALAGFAVRNVAKFAPAMFDPPPGVQHDHQILGELALRLGTPPGAARRRAHRKSGVAARLGPERMLDWMLRRGPYGLRLKQLQEAPDGLDLGPLQPNLLGRLANKQRRIELAPEIYLKDLERLRTSISAAVPGLSLIGRRDVRSNNSWLHNSQRLVKGKPRCTLLMHPADAAPRNIADGQIVRVASRVGEVEVAVEISDAMMPGVVSLPHGWGHNRPGARLSVAGRHAGVSMNDLVDDQQVDLLTGTAVLNGTPVEVRLRELPA